MGIFILLYFAMEIYAAFFVLFIIIQLVRRKKINWRLISINIAGLALILFLGYLVDERILILFGDYVDAPGDWGEGLANLYVWMINMAVPFLILIISQVLFWRQYRKFRRSDKFV